MNLTSNVKTQGDVKERKTYEATVTFSFTEEELASTIAMQFTKKQFFDMISKKSNSEDVQEMS